MRKIKDSFQFCTGAAVTARSGGKTEFLSLVVTDIIVMKGGENINKYEIKKTPKVMDV